MTSLRFTVSGFLPLIMFAITSSQRATLTKDDAICGLNGLCKCKKNFTHVNCTNLDLLVVPPTLPHNVEWLDLSYNLLQRITNRTFSSYPSLQSLYLNHNQISEIEGSAFLSNPNIKHLELQYNRLQSITNSTVSPCRFLGELYLSHNEISEIHEEAFDSNPNLRYLALQNNNLRSLLPFMYKPIPKVSVVLLSGNKLVNVTPSSFKGLGWVQCFALNGNQITRLPGDLFVDMYLKKTLDLSDNLIQDVPENLFIKNDSFHKITKLFLHKNKLQFLRRNTFKGLYNLIYLFLNSNHLLHGLENGAFIGSKVKFIYLFGNNFTDIGHDPFNNENISEVHLYKNPIKTLRTESLKGFKGNVTLYLGCKSLKELPRYFSNITIECVGSEFVPTIIADKSFIKILSKEGFNCTRFKPRKTQSFECQPCRPGTFGNGENGCISCPSGGFYQDEIGQTADVPGGMACKQCNNGTFVKLGHAESIGNCQVCPEGTNQTISAGYRACACKDNYTRIDRFGECLYCFEEGLNCSLDYKFLLPGFYWNWSFPAASINEYKDFVSNLRNESRFFNISTTTYKKSLPRVHQCPRPESCVNNEGYMADKLEGSCKRGYKGWLCSKCQSGYYAILDNCKPCPNKFWLYVEIVILMCLCLALYFFVRWQNKHDSNLRRNQRTIIDKVSSRMKILLGFYQVVGELFESLHGLNWKYPFRLLGEFISYIKLSVLRLLYRPQCFHEDLEINPILQFKIRLCLPFGFVVLCFILYQVRKAYVIYRFKGNIKVQKKTLGRFKATLYTYTLLFLFITYPPICDAIFSLYPGACQKFYFDKGNNYSILLLRSDFNINCDNLAVYHILAFVATALYVVAFPCVLLFFLRTYHKNKLNVKTPRENMRPDSIQSEICPLLSIDEVEQAPVPVWLKFLCENYKRQFWFWEIIELVRKVAQTTMVTLLGWEDDLTIMFTIGAAVLFLALHARYLPMKNAFEQRLQLFSLTAIFINVMAKAIPTHHEEVVQSSVILLNVTIGLVVFAEAVIGIFSYIRRKKIHSRITNIITRAGRKY